MSKKILIVDDEEDIINVLFSRLSAEGFEVNIAFDGTNAITCVTEDSPDLIILDIMMPGKDGTQVASEIRSNPKTAKIPIIFLSALKTQSDSDGTGELGEYTIFPKPYDFDTLLAKINELI